MSPTPRPFVSVQRSARERPAEKIGDPHRARHKHQPEVRKASIAGDGEPPFRSGHIDSYFVAGTGVDQGLSRYIDLSFAQVLSTSNCAEALVSQAVGPGTMALKPPLSSILSTMMTF